MAMTPSSPEVQELLKLLQDKFGLPEGVVDFTLTAGVNRAISILVNYVPQRDDIPTSPPPFWRGGR